jgi:hypothetical protein
MNCENQGQPIAIIIDEKETDKTKQKLLLSVEPERDKVVSYLKEGCILFKRIETQTAPEISTDSKFQCRENDPLYNGSEWTRQVVLYKAIC